jgi:hypothetical protein
MIGTNSELPNANTVRDRVAGAVSRFADSSRLDTVQAPLAPIETREAHERLPVRVQNLSTEADGRLNKRSAFQLIQY